MGGDDDDDQADDATPSPLDRIWWVAPARDGLLFVGGLVGFMFVLLTPELRDPSILVLLAGMMGLPAFLQSRDP